MYAKLKTITISVIILFITFSIITFPKQTLTASVHGLHTWWEIVFPSLLPFFIMAELLISFGIVQFFGVLFEPVMRPLFNVPGAGSFAWILGMVSGFPSGAKITVLLRENNDVSQIEAERLLSFSNAASPLFIFGAIAVGFFHSVQLGVIIAISHYTSNIIVGLLMKIHHSRESSRNASITNEKTQWSSLLPRAFSQMHRTRIRETRPFGELFGDAILTSIQTLLIIGGFIILFSVFTSLLQVIHLIDLLQFIIAPILQYSSLNTEIIPPFITGLFEITMGADAVSNTSTIPLLSQLMLISFILGFNGFSIQAQVASLISTTDIRFRPYFIARLIHAVVSSVITGMLYIFYFKHESEITDTISAHASLPFILNELIAAITKMGPIFTIISLFVATAILIRRLTI